MANVNIKFNGKEFLLSCENGQEEDLEELSIHLNKKFNNLILWIFFDFLRLRVFFLIFDFNTNVIVMNFQS